MSKAEPLDTLPGQCPICNDGHALIDTDGRSRYWVLCDPCNHTFFECKSANRVKGLWIKGLSHWKQLKEKLA